MQACRDGPRYLHLFMKDGFLNYPGHMYSEWVLTAKRLAVLGIRHSQLLRIENDKIGLHEDVAQNLRLALYGLETADARCLSLALYSRHGCSMGRG